MNHPQLKHLRFIPDVYEYFRQHERDALQSLGKARALKSKSAAQALIYNNVLSRKILREVLSTQLQTEPERLITLFMARTLLEAGPESGASSEFKQNKANAASVLWLLRETSDQLVNLLAPNVLKELGFDAILGNFPNAPSKNTSLLNQLMATLIEKNGNISAIINSVENFCQQYSAELKHLDLQGDNLVTLTQNTMHVLIRRFNEEISAQSDRCATLTYHDSLNNLSNAVTLFHLVQDTFADMKKTIPVSPAIAERYIVAEIALMSDAEHYKVTGLTALLKNLRCAEDRVKIAIINRILTIMNSLNDAFFIDPSYRKVVHGKITDQLQQLVKAEDRFSFFAKNRL